MKAGSVQGMGRSTGPSACILTPLAANVNAIKLEAFKYYYAPAGATGVAGICAKPTPEMLKLQADIIDAAKPFMLETGPIGAFTAAHDEPATDAAIIQYVSTFVSKMSGGNFNPNVSTGVAPKEHLDKMLAESFENFTSSPTGAAVYQLGPFGSASGQPSPSLSSILLFPSQILSPPPTLI